MEFSFLGRGIAGGRNRLRNNVAHRLVEGLHIDGQWNIEKVTQAVETRIDRVITICPLPERIPVGLCGLWVSCEDQEVVLHRPSSVAAFWGQYVGHELGHIMWKMCKESPGYNLASEPVDRSVIEFMGSNLAPILEANGISLATVRAARQPSTWGTNEEEQAERIGRLIATRCENERPPRDVVGLFGWSSGPS